MLAAVIGEAFAIVVLGLLVAGLLRSHGEILRALHGLGANLDPDGGAPTIPAAQVTSLRAEDVAHDLSGHGLDGSAVSIGVVGAGHDTVLAFLSSSCHSCAPFWEALRDGDHGIRDARLVVVVHDEESTGRIRDLAGPDLDVVVSAQAWDDYGVPGSPHVVHVHGPTGRVVGEGTGQTWSQVADMLMQGQQAGARPLTMSLEAADDHDNAARIDRELAAVGIGRGHPSLTPNQSPVEPGGPSS